MFERNWWRWYQEYTAGDKRRHAGFIYVGVKE